MIVRTLYRQLLVWLMLLSSGLYPVAHAQPSQPNAGSQLWMDISIGEPMIEWFNQNARPDDIARVDHLSDLPLLDEVETGRRLVVFKTIAEAEQFVPELVGKMDIIGYNLEHGPANSPAEQADPLGSVLHMKELAERYEMQLAFGPDRSFALQDGVAVAPYVDIFILQVQRVQTEAQTVRDFVLPLVTQLRAANPALEVSVQIAAQGESAGPVDLVQSMQDSLDGVSFLTDHESVGIVEVMVAELRPSTAATPIPASQTPTTVVATPPKQQTLATATMPAREALPIVPATPTRPGPSPTPLPQLPSAQGANAPWFWIATSILAAIVVVALVISTVLYASQGPPIR